MPDRSTKGTNSFWGSIQMQAATPWQQRLTNIHQHVAVHSNAAFKTAAMSTVILLLMALPISVFIRNCTGPMDSRDHNTIHHVDRWRETTQCSKQLGIPSAVLQSSLESTPGTAGSLQPASTWRRPAVLLIGDSITEAGEDDQGGWSSKLRKAYTRKVGHVS
jgi:hypothetical protein